MTGLFCRSGIYNTAPLFEYFTDFLKSRGNKFHRKFVMSAVDVESGVYRTFDETKPEEAVKGALSSSAMPFVFNNQKLSDGRIMMDGGSVWNTNIISAIHKCNDMGFDDSKIIIDIITC